MMQDYKLYKGAWVSVLPPHKEQRLSSAKSILQHGGFLVRNVFQFDTSTPTDFWFVIKDSFGGMEELSSKMRNQVKKSLRTYDIERISAEEMLQVGYPIFVSAIESYKVKAQVITYEQFARRIHTATDADFWCVYDKLTRKAVALAINTVADDYCEYNTMKCDPAYLRNSTYPYYGLIYEMNRYYLDECKLKYVSDGARTITEHSNIQPFLMDKFRFRKAFCHLQIIYTWWMKIAVNILYPFRKIIPIAPVKAILYMEEMHRGSKIKSV